MAENYPVGNIDLNNVEEFFIDNEEVVIEPTSDFIVDAPEIKKDYPTGIITDYLKNSAPPPIDYGGVIDASNIPVGNINFSNIFLNCTIVSFYTTTGNSKIIITHIF